MNDGGGSSVLKQLLERQKEKLERLIQKLLKLLGKLGWKGTKWAFRKAKEGFNYQFSDIRKKVESDGKTKEVFNTDTMSYIQSRLILAQADIDGVYLTYLDTSVNGVGKKSTQAQLHKDNKDFIQIQTLRAKESAEGLTPKEEKELNDLLYKVSEQGKISPLADKQIDLQNKKQELLKTIDENKSQGKDTTVQELQVKEIDETIENLDKEIQEIHKLYAKPDHFIVQGNISRLDWFNRLQEKLIKQQTEHPRDMNGDHVINEEDIIKDVHAKTIIKDVSEIEKGVQLSTADVKEFISQPHIEQFVTDKQYETLANTVSMLGCGAYKTDKGVKIYVSLSNSEEYMKEAPYSSPVTFYQGNSETLKKLKTRLKTYSNDSKNPNLTFAQFEKATKEFNATETPYIAVRNIDNTYTIKFTDAELHEMYCKVNGTKTPSDYKKEGEKYYEAQKEKYMSEKDITSSKEIDALKQQLADNREEVLTTSDELEKAHKSVAEAKKVMDDAYGKTDKQEYDDLVKKYGEAVANEQSVKTKFDGLNMKSIQLEKQIKESANKVKDTVEKTVNEVTDKSEDLVEKVA